MKGLELDYMEHGYVRITDHKRGLGTSRNLKLVVKSHMMLFDTVKMVEGNLVSLRLV